MHFIVNLHNKYFSSFTGICMRWLLGTLGDSTQILLIAQALPCSYNVIEANPSLQTDNTRESSKGRPPKNPKTDGGSGTRSGSGSQSRDKKSGSQQGGSKGGQGSSTPKQTGTSKSNGIYN